MARIPAVIGVDVGTSGVRAVALSLAGEVIGEGAAAFAAPERRAPDAWRRGMREALAGVMAAHPGIESRAIAIDATSGTLLPVDAQGVPLAPPLMYDAAVDASDIHRRIAAHAPRESAAHGATSGLAKALWLQDVPGVTRILHQADWLTGLLTGDFTRSDENNALKTGYDPVARAWPEWLGDTGMRVGLLPAVVPAGTLLGRITRAAAEEFALAPDTLVTSGTTDGCASFLATGATRAGAGVSSLGSTLTIKMLAHRPLFAPEYGVYSHRIGDEWLVGGASNTGGAVLAHHFTPERLRELSARIDPETDTGLDYYPLLRPGERFPIRDPHLAPRMVPRPPDDARFLQALFEGMAAIEALAWRRMEELGAPKLISLCSVGGGAANPVWRRIRERRIPVPFVAPRSDKAAAGVARLALAAIGGAA